MAWVLLALFALLSLGDAVTTYLNITRDYGTEGNPTMGWIMHRLGLVPALVLTKALGVGTMALTMRAYPWAWPLIALFDVGMAWVVFHNYSIWRDHRRRRL